MSEEIRWNLSVQAVSGPAVASSGTLPMDEYRKSQVVVPAHDSGTDGTLDVTVNTVSANLLVIKAGQYVDEADAAKILTYDVNDAGTPKELVAPILLIGSEAVKLLADPVTKLTFTNPIEVEIQIDIIVGGDATP